MTILRTVCPSCDVVRVNAEDATLRRPEGTVHVEVEFSCPRCTARVVQHLNVKMLPLLVSAGCCVEDLLADHDEGAISEAEIQSFVEDLERLDWADELAY